MEKTSHLTFKEFLTHIRSKATSKRGLGDLFERAIRDYLKASPEHDFEDVWLWSQWPDLKKYQFTRQDLGIDLVAKEQQTGKLWAIQCKCYGEDVQVTKADIDSFFNHSGKKPFEARLIVTTTNNWHPHATGSIENQSTPCHSLKLADLEEASFDWSITGKVKRRPNRKILMDHQREAVKKASEHFQNHERGQMIMACGTGKTLTSLAIVEEITSENAKVLFLAPSIALVNQTLREYAYQHRSSQSYLVVCSDTKVGKEETGQTISDLQRSPTTDPQEIAKHLRNNRRLIVFCTYQSLKQIKEAQSQYKAPAFDLVICDEAHRTTGIKGDEPINGKTKGNYFTLINNPDYVKAKKRLYMTATPKIYSPKVKSKASKDNIEIHCMDNVNVYGEEFYRLDFSKAIEQKLLSDYQVIILDIEERFISDQMGLQAILQNTNLSLKDASLLIGCYKALRDQGDEDKGVKLKRAVAFLNTIKSSKDSKDAFHQVVKALEDHQDDGFTCETEHIDGKDHSITKSKKLDWLKADAGLTENREQICRILMNAKCLTEGIDVPSLDAVMFLHPRKSQVDVVQAVGRAIRKLSGKKYGYIILPVVIPAGETPEQALDDNKTYQVVWQGLNALRSHDSQFNAIINNLDLNENKTSKIKIINVGGNGKKGETDEGPTEGTDKPTNPEISKSIQQYTIDQIEHKIYAKIVEKCGDRAYRETWIKGIKDTVQTLQTRINSLISGNSRIEEAFQKYLSGLHNSINPQITKETATSMLAEHIVTKEVFDKIFEGYRFSDHNPISKTIQKFLSSLDQYGFSNELKQLEGFYDSVGPRISKIDNSKGRQKAIKDLYGDFIKEAFPKMAERLGVAYTPVEIVDFILQSADEILKQEFGRGLTDKNVHIIDPFVGTGTFINRLIQNDHEMIKDKDLKRKFERELHANEILLLPYYIASINIEEAYHSRMSGDYKSFPGITLTDTFNLDEQNKVLDSDGQVINVFGEAEHKPFAENEKRIHLQKNSSIKVIVGNPPYSVGQKSENDGNKNTKHFLLDKKIQDTYKKESHAKLQRNLDDSYVKAIRWATDRLGERQGLIGFVHNASLLYGNSTDGFRKCLVKEFDAIYCFDLRGNVRKFDKKEGENIFGQVSMVPICITFLIKHTTESKKNTTAKIHYHDIGDYLSCEKKLKIIQDFQSINGIKWKNITPDSYGDWIHQRNTDFEKFLPLGGKKSEDAIFDLYSLGIATNRDSWAYNFNRTQVQENMETMIDFYNQELERLKNEALTLKNIDKFIDRDKTKISWTHRVKEKFIKKEKINFQLRSIKASSYRPFMKKWVYFDHLLNERRYQLPKIFPQADTQNQVICVSGVGAKIFSTLMTDSIPCLDFINKTQCFPFYHFDQNGNRKESITDHTLEKFQKHYKNTNISKWDIFHYIYGLLHSEDYRAKYKNNLSKQLPRIPFVSDFWQFSKTGKELANLHLNYEDQPSTTGVEILKDGQPIKIEILKPEDLKVTKMKINKQDQSKIQFNESISIEGIPKEAWEYKINDCPAIKWIVDRYQVKTDKASHIKNDPNAYSDDPAYILKLLLSIITVSIQTQALVKNLPSLDFDELATVAEREKEKQEIQKTKEGKSKRKQEDE